MTRRILCSCLWKVTFYCSSSPLSNLPYSFIEITSNAVCLRYYTYIRSVALKLVNSMIIIYHMLVMGTWIYFQGTCAITFSLSMWLSQFLRCSLLYLRLIKKQAALKKLPLHPVPPFVEFVPKKIRYEWVRSPRPSHKAFKWSWRREPLINYGWQ